MRYVIRKVPERDTSYLERLIPGALVYSDVLHEGPIKAFVAAMEMADDDAVYIQDDMILCEDFFERCNKICADHRNEVVQLANSTFLNDQTRVLVGGYHKPAETPWCMCIYIPKRVSALFVRKYRAGEISISDLDLRKQADDWTFAHFVEYIGEDEYLVVPNLAGHPLNHSVVSGERDRQIRISMNFEYDKAVPRGDMSRELKYYYRDYEKFNRLRALQESGDRV